MNYIYILTRHRQRGIMNIIIFEKVQTILRMERFSRSVHIPSPVDIIVSTVWSMKVKSSNKISIIYESLEIKLNEIKNKI